MWWTCCYTFEPPPEHTGRVTVRTRPKTVQPRRAYSCHNGVNNPGSQCIRLISLITCISLWGLDTPPLIKMMDGGIRGMLSPVPNLFLFRKVLIREHLGEWRGGGELGYLGESRGGEGRRGEEGESRPHSCHCWTMITTLLNYTGMIFNCSCIC